MTDRRQHPGNGRVVLQGHAAVGGEVPVAGRSARLTSDAWLRCTRQGRRNDRQVLHGNAVTAIDQDGAEAFVQVTKDGYCGWIPAEALGPDFQPTDRVTVRTTYGYPAASMKDPARLALHFGSEVQVVSRDDDWACLSTGVYVPARHLGQFPMEPCAVARLYLGTPYVWGGNTGHGIDCSGLSQAALLAAGISCPGDSDQQEAMPWAAVDIAQAQPGDLVFWQGHVALVSGHDQIIHANAHHMMTVEEPLSVAIDRIAATDTGPVTACLRPTAG